MLFHMDMLTVNLYHIFILSSVLVAIGILKEDTPKYLYYILALLSLMIIIFVPFPNLSISYWNFVKLSHYLFLLPVLLYISYLGIVMKKFDNYVYDTFVATGLVIVVYHAYKIYSRMSYKKN